MKVYTAERVYEYEGFEILGIFTTEKAAEDCIENNVDEDSGVS